MYCFLIEQLFTFLDKGILEEIFDQTRLLKLEKKVRTREDISTVQGLRGWLFKIIIWLELVNITRPVIGQYSRLDFPVMPMGIMSDVNTRLVKQEYRKINVKVHLIQKVQMIWS